MLRLLLLLLVGSAIAQESGDYAPQKEDQLIKAANEEVDHFDESPDEANEEEEDEKDVSLCQENELIEPDFTENATCPRRRFHFFSANRGFFKAQHICRCRRGSLSSIHNWGTNNLLRTFLSASYKNGAYVWIGVWKRNSCFPYRNIDGSRLNYTNWGWGQRKVRGRWCTAMNIRSGQWFSLKCHSRLPFVCTY
ncbi:bone marrow proteoglycan [Eleutherodactylus coqui]|uniref:bone marrow proteoglycan n=1 Tax=Eleutherodactylus coqui TaxID=57060 RepID=UPI0034628BCE